MIPVCTHFRDLNRDCPKDNFLTPFIDHILDECVGSKVFSFMDGFSRYNQILINLEDQHKTAFIFPWCTFSYQKIPFDLKNVEASFQWAMTSAFHDLKMIIEVYLDDLATHSHLRVCHPYHVRLMFERCHHYQVHLNPHKCIFCVTVGRLLGFIVSKEVIKFDPLKVEAILQLSPPRNIRHLQCLQGMENFLRRFVVNFDVSLEEGHSL